MCGALPGTVRDCSCLHGVLRGQVVSADGCALESQLGWAGAWPDAPGRAVGTRYPADRISFPGRVQLPAGGGLGASSKGGTLVQIGAKSQKQVATQSAFSCAWGCPWSHRHCDGTRENGAAWPALRAGGGQ